MTKNIPLIFLLFIFITACKKDATNLSLRESIGKIDNHRVSVDQASKIAIVQSIYPESIEKYRITKGEARNSAVMDISQKAKPAKKIKSTFSVNQDSTDPTFYIINYEDGGFIIVSGDDRILPILAFSDESSFPIEKGTTYPGGLVQWLKKTDETVKESRKNHIEQNIIVKKAWEELQIKSQLVTNDPQALVNFPSCLVDGDTYSVTKEVASFVTTRWSQGAGFNDLLSSSTSCATPNNRPPIGCVATAIGQVMYFHKFPVSSIGDWASMNLLTGGGDTPYLMYDIADKVDMNFDCEDGSWAWPSNIDDALHEYGYSATFHAPYKHQSVRSDLFSGKPVILTGAGDGWWFFPDLEVGHAWVADGIRTTDYYVCDADLVVGPVLPRGPSGPPTNPPTGGGSWFNTYSTCYYHMNWGWGGSFDAWFAYNNWVLDGDELNEWTRSITNIHPN